MSLSSTIPQSPSAVPTSTLQHLTTTAPTNLSKSTALLSPVTPLLQSVSLPSPVNTKTEANVLSILDQQQSASSSSANLTPQPNTFSSEQSKYSDLNPSAFIGHFMDISSLHPVVKSFIVGSISGCCSTVLFQPLDLLKTRLQNPAAIGHGGGGMFTVAGHIVRNERVFGLWKGMVPSLTRCVPGVGLYFASIHSMKIFFDIGENPTPVQSILLGATGRCLSGVVMIPFTVIKTRFESKVYQYGSIREALRLIYRVEGVRGLTCGLLPTLLRDAPFSGLYLMMYTSAKQFVPQELMDSNTTGPYVRFSCGIVAGFGASIVTQPADVIKTKMQLFPAKFQTLPPVITYVYNRYGLRGYFKGLLPRMVRRTLVAAMSWTVYEQVMRNVGLK